MLIFNDISLQEFTPFFHVIETLIKRVDVFLPVYKARFMYEIPMIWMKKDALETGAKDLRQAYTLYSLEDCGLKGNQPVLAGRRVLLPNLSLRDFRCGSVIDWIEFEFPTVGEHQATNIQRFAVKYLQDTRSSSTLYITGPNQKKWYQGRQFRIRLQQPNPDEFKGFLGALSAKYPTAKAIADLRILEIEVSVDFYVLKKFLGDQNAAGSKRELMVDLLRRHLMPHTTLTKLPGGAPRFYDSRKGAKGGTRILEFAAHVGHFEQEVACHALKLGTDILKPFDPAIHHRTPIDTTSYVGCKPPIQIRVMDKVTDNRDPVSGSHLELPLANRRARVEITFYEGNGYEGVTEALGLNTLADLRDFQFKDLRKMAFEYFLPTISDSTPDKDLPFDLAFDEWDVFSKSGIYGYDCFHRSISTIARERFRRRQIKEKPAKLGRKGYAVSYEELNRMMDRALKRLSDEWGQYSA